MDEQIKQIAERLRGLRDAMELTPNDIANECGIKIDLDMVNQISARTPNICHLAPAGHAYMEDLNEAGGIYAVLNELTKKNLLHTDVMTVTGKTMAENAPSRANTTSP